MQNIIWLGFDFGEWGGDLILFNTVEKKFIEPSFTSRSLNLPGVHAIFDDSASVYVAASLRHMFMTRGSIIRFNDLQPTTLFSSQSDWGKTDTLRLDNPPRVVLGRSMEGGEYIGPAVYEKNSNMIYFYSQNGFYKGYKNNDLSKITNWTLLAKPKLNWSGGQQYAAGPPINVVKIVLTGTDKFYFLSQNNGLGYFDGHKLTMLE